VANWTDQFPGEEFAVVSDAAHADQVSRRQALLRSAQLGTAAAGLALAASLPGVASAAASPYFRQTKGKIIFVTHDLNEFFVPIILGSREFANYVGWDHQFVGPSPGDVQKTVDAQLNAIQQGPTAVGFTIIDPNAFTSSVSQAIQAGISVVIYNTADPQGMANVQQATGVMPGFVGQEFIGAGKTQGMLAAKLAQQYTGKTSGKIVVQNIQPGHFALETRAKGTGMGIDAYNQANGTSFSWEQLASSTNEVEASSRIAAKWAADGDQIVGWASTDFTHGFVGNWAKQNGLVGKFSVGGFDLTPTVMTNIGDGSVDWTVGQNPYGQGWITASLAYMQSQYKYPAFNYDTGAELVTKDNIAAILQREQVWTDRRGDAGFR
jgi:ribose transport system substrate-binding protein